MQIKPEFFLKTCRTKLDRKKLKVGKKDKVNKIKWRDKTRWWRKKKEKKEKR